MGPHCKVKSSTCDHPDPLSEPRAAASIRLWRTKLFVCKKMRLVTIMIFQDVSFLFISHSLIHYLYVIWHLICLYIFWYHSSMYISVLCTCLKARAHWRRCVGLACLGGPGRERIPGDPGDPYNWNPILGIRRFDKDMQLFYKILLWREGCLLSSWKPSAAAPADLRSILKHCIKLLKICLQPTGSAARFSDQFEITWPNGFVTLV